MADYLIQDTTLDAIADAINAKTGGSSAMTPAQMVTAIGNISGGGGGYTLLASGTYTVASASSSIDIPVNFSGTPKTVLVTKDDITGMTNGVVLWAILYNYEPLKLFNDFGEFRLWKYFDNSTVVKAITYYKAVDMVSNNTIIKCARYGPTIKIESGDYSWYIWG